MSKAVIMTNSKEMPTWFNAAPTNKAETLDFLVLAKEVSGMQRDAATRHYIHCLLQRIEDEHAFRRTPLTADEIEACRILRGYQKQYLYGDSV
jgi:uncharacterized protein YndB with AHSA1/START domain